MCAMRLTGYADRFGVHPGDKIKFYVNCDGPAEYKAEVVQMINGDTNPRGPGFIEHSVKADVNKTYKGRKQIIHGGSYGFVADAKALHVESFTLQCWIWPTTPKTHPRYWKHGAQGLVTKWSGGKGYGLFINEDGCVELRINEHKITTGAPIRDHAWHFLAASFDAETGEVVLYHEPQVVYALDPVIEPVRTTIKTKIAHSPIPVGIACYVDKLDDGPLAQSSMPAGVVFAGKYNGKIDSPRISKKALNRFEIEQMKGGAQPGLTERRNSGPTGALSEVIVAAWDFGDGINTIVAKDNGPYRLDARLVNCPTRGMTGHNWCGQNFDWKHSPKEYGAIHFHDDDVDDARWTSDIEWTVPSKIKSRFYALKLTTAEGDGVFMLVAPMDWYFAVPGVTTTGAFNQHFVRDIGLIFLFIGTAFLLGAARRHLRVALWAAATLWLWGHALFHFWEVAVGICEPFVLARDFPAVTLPALLGAAITIWAVLDARKAHARTA